MPLDIWWLLCDHHDGLRSMTLLDRIVWTSKVRAVCKSSKAGIDASTASKHLARDGSYMLTRTQWVLLGQWLPQMATSLVELHRKLQRSCAYYYQHKDLSDLVWQFDGFVYFIARHVSSVSSRREYASNCVYNDGIGDTFTCIHEIRECADKLLTEIRLVWRWMAFPTLNVLTDKDPELHAVLGCGESTVTNSSVRVQLALTANRIGYHRITHSMCVATDFIKREFED